MIFLLRENLEFHAMMYGRRKDERNRRSDKVLEAYFFEKSESV
jgi:ABC-type multidrug transport system ATPase subunit